MTQEKWTYILDDEVKGKTPGYCLIRPNGDVHQHVQMYDQSTKEVEIDAQREIAKRNIETQPAVPNAVPPRLIHRS